MQSTNIGRTPERREGRRTLLAVSAALVMALAALLLTLALTSSIEPSALPSLPRAQEASPRCVTSLRLPRSGCPRRYGCCGSHRKHPVPPV